MSWVIEVGSGGCVMNVVETKDGYRSFRTKSEAATRVIEMVDRDMHLLKCSKRRALRILAKGP